MQIIFFLFVAVICFYLARKVSGVSSESTESYKQKYRKALDDGNKKLALEYGRKYYQSLRWHNGYRLTIYDEQKIQNDISVYCGKSIKIK